MELSKNDFIKYKVFNKNGFGESVAMIIDIRGKICKIIDIKNKNIYRINLNLEKIYKITPLEIELI